MVPHRKKACFHLLFGENYFLSFLPPLSTCGKKNQNRKKSSYLPAYGAKVPYFKLSISKATLAVELDFTTSIHYYQQLPSNQLLLGSRARPEPRGELFLIKSYFLIYCRSSDAPSRQPPRLRVCGMNGRAGRIYVTR